MFLALVHEFDDGYNGMTLMPGFSTFSCMGVIGYFTDGVFPLALPLMLSFVNI